MSRRKESFSTHLDPELVAWFRERANTTRVPIARYVEQALVDLRAKLVAYPRSCAARRIRAKPPEEPQL